MSKTARGTWKAVERRAAALFATRRQIGSGSGGRPDETCSDSRHARLFLEVKLRASHAVRTLYDATKRLATKERKTPVLMLADKNRPGFLVCVHSDDLDALVVEWGALHANRLYPEIVTTIRANYGVDDPREILLPRENEDE